MKSFKFELGDGKELLEMSWRDLSKYFLVLLYEH